MNITATINCPKCHDPMTVDDPGDYMCPTCQHQFHFGPRTRTGHVVKKQARLGWFTILEVFGWPLAIICGLVLAAGLFGGGAGAAVGLVIAGPGFIIGAALLSTAAKFSKSFLCSECGNKVEKTSKLCPTCSARLQ